MADQQTNNKLSEEERMKQMAAQMRAAEYKGLSEEEIQERERQKEMRRKKTSAAGPRSRFLWKVKRRKNIMITTMHGRRTWALTA